MSTSPDDTTSLLLAEEEEIDQEAPLEHEQRDIHEIDEMLADLLLPESTQRSAVRARSIREIPGMGGKNTGKVYDYRGTGLCSANGGRIRLLGMVHHIPVVPNRKGVADGIQLAQILRAQGLSIQAATDSEGNVFRYTSFNELCYGQRGANSLMCGVEHMHLKVSEPWTKWQMRAAAWCAARVWEDYGVPPQRAILAPGGGRVIVKRKGHTSHMTVSKVAGFNDRSDPGAGFDYAELYELTRYYAKHHRF